ncbi:MAG: NAD-dependent succinate-semialdehyde dehydrogenase [Gammaproteobacteria bacterium]
MSIQTINPATESILEAYPVMTQSAIGLQIEAAESRFHLWKRVDLDVRAKLLLSLAKLLRSQAADFAGLMAQEMGKPITAGKLEIEKCALVCEHYAQHGADYLLPEYITTEHHRAKVCYQPQGIVFAVMPWNFPFWQVFRFAAPNIMAGNVGILKHAPITTGAGLAIEKAFLDAGFPEHVFSTMVLTNEQTASVIAHKYISGVTFTGSEQTGMILAASAGSHLKKIVVELGGNDPYLILEDAELDWAAQVVVASRLNNNGQTCIAAKRIIVVSDVADALIEKILALVQTYQYGDPLDPNTKLGPMARDDLRLHVHQQVRESIAKGAMLRLGGNLPKERGYYYPATVLTHVRPGMPAFDDEVFGPVFAITLAADEADAIQLANHSRFGLGAAVFTQNIERGERIATEELQVGQAAVNSAVASDPRLPFGGTKHSGFGRELAREGIREFMNIKTVVVNQSE